MANGRVITGYSKPIVANYSVEGTTVSYTSAIPLARGVDINIDIETADSNDFFADNVLAESASGTFSSGTATATVDGLKDAARQQIQGLPEATSVTVDGSTVNVYEYDDRQVVPYQGFGFVVRVMEDGITSYIPYVLPKVQFAADGLSAATQEEEIEWQTSELEAAIYRDDSEHHRWRRIGAAQTTEASAEAVVRAMLA